MQTIRCDLRAILVFFTCAALIVSPTAATAITPELFRQPGNLPMTQTGSGPYEPVSPVRLLDTRETGKRLSAGGVTVVSVLGRAGVPARDVRAVSVNLTAVDPAGKGFITAFSSGGSRPSVSTLNFRPNTNTANHAIVPVGADGKIVIYAHAETDVLADITGYVPMSSGVVTVQPARALDTRSSGQPVAAGSAKSISVAGRFGIPASDVAAVIANITAVEPQADGFFAAYPSSGTKPSTSTLNFKRGENTANNALIKLGDDGAISVHSHVQAHLIVDIVGYVSAGAAFSVIAPARSVDTRRLTVGRMRAGEERTLRIAGTLGMPATDMTAVAVNVVAVTPAEKGYLALYPAGVKRPLVSTVNFGKGSNTANNALVKLNSSGEIRVYSHVDADIVLDVVGYVTKNKPYSGPVTENSDGRTRAIAQAPGRETTIETKPTLPANAVQQLAQITKQGSLVGAPAKLTLSGSFPADGVRLERSYPTALPPGASVVFTYWDESVGGWIPVPAVISADRRSAHAIVRHYSFWTDVIDGTMSSLKSFTENAGNFVQGVSRSVVQNLDQFNKTLYQMPDALAYEIGAITDSRSQPQTCNVPLPDWVAHASFIEQHFNNPVHWCVQGVPGSPKKVAISAKANRGHGFVIKNIPSGASIHNDSYDFDFNRLVSEVTNAKAGTVSRSPAWLIFDKRYIPAGATATIMFDDKAYYGEMKRNGEIFAEMPHWLLVVQSILTTQLINTGESLLEGRKAATLLVANCIGTAMNIDHFQGNMPGLAACLAQHNDLKDFDKVVTPAARTLALKANVWIAVLSAANNGMVAALDHFVGEDAYKAGASGKTRMDYRVKVGLGGSVSLSGRPAPKNAHDVANKISQLLGPPDESKAVCPADPGGYYYRWDNFYLTYHTKSITVYEPIPESEIKPGEYTGWMMPLKGDVRRAIDVGGHDVRDATLGELKGRYGEDMSSLDGVGKYVVWVGDMGYLGMQFESDSNSAKLTGIESSWFGCIGF